MDIGGLTDDTDYYVINSTSSEFQLSATLGGTAINLTPNYSVSVSGSDASAVDVSNDKIIVANTFTDGDFISYDNGGGTDIGGLTDGDNYYIVNATASEFQLSLTSGGAAIDITGLGVGGGHVFREDIGSSHDFRNSPNTPCLLYTSDAADE